MGGQAEGCALDCLSGVAKVLHNDERKFWVMKHGLCLPASRGGVARASEQVRYSEKHKQPGDLTLAETIAQNLRVGVHWDTEVQSGGHHVCQVLCSALPVGLLKDARASDYAPLAIALLNGAQHLQGRAFGCHAGALPQSEWGCFQGDGVWSSTSFDPNADEDLY